MSNYRSSRLLTPVGSGFLQHFWNIYIVDHEKQTRIFSHPMDFSWSAMWVLWHIPSTRECTYVQHLAEYLWTYFSEDTGVPVCWICHMHPIKIYSNIRFQNISSWSDICNICLAFWTECDGNSSTSFSKIGLYVIKRQESTRLQTFLSV